MQERIAKYLANEMDKAEKLTFESQLGEDIALQEELYFQLTLLHSIDSSNIQSFNTSKAEAKVMAQINESKTISISRKRNFTFLKVAATLLIVLVAGFFITKNLPKTEKAPLAVFETENGIKAIEWGDGTIVRLNANSVLEVAHGFNEGNRNIKLTGAAYFDVASNKELPFVITANNSSVQVLGTAFQVDAYPEDEVVLNVTEGRVKFASATSSKEDLFIAGEKGVLSKDGAELTKTTVKNGNYSSWWTKRLVFEDATLAEVFEDLENTYWVTIEYSEALGGCRYGAILENYTLEEVLEAIKTSYPDNISKVEIKDSLIKLEGTACKN